MSHHDFILLLHKKWTSSISPSELKHLEEHLSSSESSRKEARELQAIWERTGEALESSFEPDVDKAYSRFRNRINRESARVVRIAFLRRVAAAAVILMILSVYIHREGIVYAPTANHASILTDINRVDNYSLPDGSVVYANRFTDLVYYETFFPRRRVVEVDGEAYFEVNPDAKRPFIVKTSYGRVRVTGTRFNVRAYPAEKNCQVYLSSGRVVVSKRMGLQKKTMEPRYSALMGSFASPIDTFPETGERPMIWKEGGLNFQSRDVNSILAVLIEYFGVELDLTGLDASEMAKTITIDFSGYSLDQSLKALETYHGFKFNKTGEDSGKPKYQVFR